MHPLTETNFIKISSKNHFVNSLLYVIFQIQTEPSDMQYLIMDLVLITIPSLVIGNTAASDVLLSQRPTRRILHPLHIFSLFSFLAIQTVAFIACWYYTQQQAWWVSSECRLKVDFLHQNLLMRMTPEKNETMRSRLYHLEYLMFMESMIV